MFKRILVISPHTDDGELAAGGTISKFIDEGKEVFYISFSSCEASVPKDCPCGILRVECKEATNCLGIPDENVILLDYEVRNFSRDRQNILEDLIELNLKIKPDLVLIPSSNDLHQDHKVINEESLRAFKKTSSIWGYEHPWNNLSFTTDVFIVLEKKHIKKKIDALSCYGSQSFRTYFNEGYIKALAHTRGVQIDSLFAETFEVLRLLVK